MERMLQKMAGQLNAYDEASLIALWDKYATIVERFEPTKRWEEAAIVFSLIQAVRLKNQLFNQHLAAGLEVARDNTPLPGLAQTKAWMEERAKRGTEAEDGDASSEVVTKGKPEKRCKVLRFGRGKRDKPV
ncbi:hypothetical protein LJC26_05180 [Desulfovibrio sp. OttesenSCG-928-O18]|nr:hypothetical protein [Desulfovibrio sp. OttesenSCG-928-O18]